MAASKLQTLNDSSPSPNADLWLSNQAPGRPAAIYDNDIVSILLSDVLVSEGSRGLDTTTIEVKSDKELAKALEAYSSKSHSIRTLHISQTDSFSHLLFNNSCLEKLMEHHKIMTDFTRIATMFSFKRDAIEDSFLGPLLQRDSPDIQEISYVIKYAECKPSSSGGTTWVIRQAGFYHQTSKSSGKSVWLFLHCQKNSPLQQMIVKALQDSKTANLIQKHPVHLHLLLSSFYMHNWRHYMSCYEAELLKKTNAALGSRLSDLPLISHSTISRIHFLSAHFAPLPSIFASQIALFKHLDTKLPNDSSHRVYHDEIASYQSLMESYSANASVLLGKCAALSQFVVDSIGISNQLTDQARNELMLEMTHATVEDSASIKVITIVTLLYLPASFVATFFGMQFFQLSTPKLWIFFASAILLTILTMLGWWWSIRSRKRRTAASPLGLEKMA